MGGYKELANRRFAYFTKNTVYGLFERVDKPDSPAVLPYQSRRQRGECQVRILQGKTQTVVMATELGENPGKSVTNAIEDIATQVVTAFHLTPASTRFIEHYNEESYAADKRAGEPPTYDEVTFMWHGEKATSPTWRRLQPHEIAELMNSE